MTKQTNKPGLWHLFQQAVKGNVQYDFTQGSIGVAAFLLAVPMVLEMAMESIFAVVDIFFVSSLGHEAVAVVGLTEAVLTLIYAIAIGLSMGVTALVARRIGEKQPEKATLLAGQALWLGLLVALLVALSGAFFAADILRLMGADSAVVAMGENYTTIMLCSAITILYLFIINAIFRGAGDASIAMRSLWLANGINILLDPILIFGLGPAPEMGVTGAAVATCIGRGVGVIYQLWHLFNAGSRIHIGWQHLRLKTAVLIDLIKVSTGGILQFLIATASWVVLVRIVSDFGSAAVAGYTIAIRVVMFTILPAWGLSNAVATLVGQNLGAGLPERAERSVWTIAKFNLIFMLTVAVVFIVFASPIIALFTQDPAVLASGVSCLRMVAYGYGFFSIGMILVQAFNGAGDTMTPTRINFFCYWLTQIPLAWVLATQWHFQAEGVYMAILVAESMIAIVGFVIFRTGKWKEVMV
ncbi:MATE family efflux transporter [Planctobacterium marinum]|uniref:MATE family efflux transporter n=1 Tax=Planctobacterium marinum TaxID=1631968 RepID=UPI001E28D03B|nr:MATE family efflux transporter [Planctobacterium marinum]MCC2606678.1 MATE family efflux transporter [Planctobacterium marinum]